MQKRKQFTIGITFLVLLCILVGCQSGKKKEKTVKKADYYIGVAIDNAPYYYKDTDGTEKGSYVTFIDKLSKEKSFTYAFVPMNRSSFEQSLSTQLIDGYIDSMIVKTGEKEDSSSDVFYTSNLCVLSPEKSGVRNLKGLADKILVAPAGTSEEVFAKYLANKYKGQAVAFSSTKEAKNDIEDGYSEALVIDEEYYKAHTEAFENWNCLKVSSRFQNKHKLYMPGLSDSKS